MRDSFLETSGQVIGFYDREYYCFSNFSSFAVAWKGRLWLTAEHAYQVAKFLDSYPEIVEEIHEAVSAHEAKKIAEEHQAKVPADWDKRKVVIMEEICLNKLMQHKYVRKKLLETGDKEIVEDSPTDSFWGWGPNQDGRNELGQIWMRLRNKLQNKDIIIEE